ncbi:MAG: MarR family transcriptional regulator [bacterium]|nr:MarR family transcriptional regulator [bacterium]MDE0600247.1 MarR family transcriptional regulator [bacterium]
MTDNQPSQHDQETPAGPPAVDLVECAENLLKSVLGGLAEEVDPYGLNAIEYSLLKACMRWGECTATDLAEVLPVDASRISRLVTGLVNKDLLIRRRLPDDRRMVMLRLSQKGIELTAMLNQRIDAHNSRLMENITGDELSVLESVTGRIIANHIALRSSR